MDLIRGQNWKTFLFTSQGRVTRRDFWLGFFLPYLCLVFLALLVDFFLLEAFGVSFCMLITTLALVYPSAIVGIKRCHDRGRSGYFLLLNFIPLGNLWLLVELGFLRGTVGPNEYGPDPLAASLAAPLMDPPAAALST